MSDHKKNQHLTPEQVEKRNDRVLRLTKQGKTCRKVGEILGISGQRVSQILEKLGHKGGSGKHGGAAPKPSIKGFIFGTLKVLDKGVEYWSTKCSECKRLCKYRRTELEQGVQCTCQKSDWQKYIEHSNYERNCDIVALADSGRTHTSIAREYQLTQGRVSSIIRRHKGLLGTMNTDSIIADEEE